MTVMSSELSQSHASGTGRLPAPAIRRLSIGAGNRPPRLHSRPSLRRCLWDVRLGTIVRRVWRNSSASFPELARAWRMHAIPLQ